MRNYAMTSFAAITATLLVAMTPMSAEAAEGAEPPMEEEWSFDGLFGRFDRQQLQRGFQVFREVCASCHGLDYIAFRNLQEIGYSEDQTKVLASEYIIEECCDDQGDIF